MKPFRHAASVLVFASATCAAATDPTLADALTHGTVALNVRLRSENVQQTGLRDANALTLRTRLGFTTAPLGGWKAMLEAENIVAFDGDGYSQAGLNPGGAGRAVVADPVGTEINQAFLSHSDGRTTLALGRQRLVLDNARFVGDVGWRQNMQTFDAAVVQNTSLDHTTLTYAYLYQIDRVFGDRHAQGDWRSDSHVFNASYTGLSAGTLTGYAYLLDFANAAANSCATYGASLVGAAKLTSDIKLAYRAEYARQSDYGSSPLNYGAGYMALEAGLVFKPGSLVFGYETLGSDHNVGFKTPLATLHAFNGWADLFLATPVAGLHDTYAKGTASLPGALSLLVFYHQFDSDAARSRFGDELDVQLSHKFDKSVSGLVKYARFNRANATFPDVEKIWLQAEFAY